MPCSFCGSTAVQTSIKDFTCTLLVDTQTGEEVEVEVFLSASVLHGSEASEYAGLAGRKDLSTVDYLISKEVEYQVDIFNGKHYTVAIILPMQTPHQPGQTESSGSQV